MIDLAAPVRTFSGVTVFADHADPKLFHYIPVSPRLVTDEAGRPELKLLKYHLDPTTQQTTGAGLFSLTVDLAVADDVLSDVHDKVADGHTGVTLAPVWADSGTCQLILLDSGPVVAGAAGPASLVASVIGGASPALASNATTLFVCALDPPGVAIVETAVRSGGLPFGVVYNLQVAGLRPAVRASIIADYQSSYHYYQNRLHGGQLLLATDIGATIADLVSQQAIKITVDDLVPDADKDGVYQHALDAVQQYVLSTLFTPTLNQSPPAAGARDTSIASAASGVLGMFTVTYSLTSIDISELKTLSYHLAAAQAGEITLAPQGELTALLPSGTNVDTLIVAVDPAPPDQLDLDIASLIDLAVEGIDHIDVTLSYAGTDTVVTLTPATPRLAQSLWYSAAGGLESPYRYEVALAATGPKGLTGRLSSPASTSVHDLIRIDPRELYRRVGIHPVLQGVPFDRFPQVILDVSVHEALDGWTVQDTVTLDASTAEASLVYRGRPEGLLEVSTRVRYIRAAGETLTRDWADTDPGVLVLGDPEPDIVDLQVLASARFGTAISRLVLELRPAADPAKISTLSFDATTRAATWSYVPAAGQRGYDYRVTIQSMTGEVRPGQWQAGPADPTLVVGEGFTRLRQVKVMFVGGTLAASGLLALRLHLSFTDPVANLAADDEFLVQDPLAPVSWSYPVADLARQDYTFTITRVHADGTSTDDPPQTGSDLLRIVPIVAATS